jgi:ligand-binding sensor domain-containing protein
LPGPKDNTIFIGTADGLYTLRENDLKKIDQLPQLTHANISSLAIDSKGQLWLAAQTGLFVLEKNKNTYRLLKAINEVNGQAIVSPQKIIHDHRGNTWVATYGSGLLLFSEAGNRLFNSAAKFTKQ